MTRISRRGFGMGAAGLLGAVAVGPNASAEEQQREPRELAALLPKAADKHGVPGITAAVIRGDAVAEQAAYGTTATENGRTVALDDSFHWGSVSKRFTATLVAHLVQHSELSYRTTLRDALPGVRMRQAYEQATIRDVLLHRAGLICLPPLELTDPATAHKLWYDIPSRHSRPTDQRAALTRHALSLPPNYLPPATESIYSNVGYSILGHIAEVVTRTPYEELLTERVLHPLGMTGTRVGGWPTSGDAGQPRGHNRPDQPGTPARAVPLDAPELPKWLAAAGGLHGPISDLAAFAIDQIQGAHGKGRLLHTEGYRNLHTPQAQGDLALMYPWMNHNGTISIGYGSAFTETSQGRMTAFAGSTGTFTADCKLLPHARLGFVALANGGWTEVGAATHEVFEHTTGVTVA
ncbi:serine hydrolase domain-containing protein [Amycolatopsis anabasis]|uniref:serine hydrolase domain-containing protein n=1 Tax=Amycolatopsis anabasis TaxID=1840409 RepID=UPI00131B3986|nr:serine hydrolase domain-containing protein [Amycolatopsis anabasis]